MWVASLTSKVSSAQFPNYVYAMVGAQPKTPAKVVSQSDGNRRSQEVGNDRNDKNSLRSWDEPCDQADDPPKYKQFLAELRAHETQWDEIAGGKHIWQHPVTPYFIWQVKGFVTSLFWLLGCGIVQSVSLDLTSRLIAAGPPLPDVVHDNIPKLQPEKTGDVMVLCLAVFMFALVFEVRHWSWRAAVQVTMTWSSLFLLRSVTTMVTSLRLTDNHCRAFPPKIEGSVSFDNMVKAVVSIGMKSIHCGDLLFSGHAMFTTMITMMTLTYSKKPIIKAICVLFALSIYFVIVATRNHYSVDVVVAIYIAIITWKLVPNYWPFFYELPDVSGFVCSTLPTSPGSVTVDMEFDAALDEVVTINDRTRPVPAVVGVLQRERTIKSVPIPNTAVTRTQSQL